MVECVPSSTVLQYVHEEFDIHEDSFDSGPDSAKMLLESSLFDVEYLVKVVSHVVLFSSEEIQQVIAVTQVS